MSLSRTASPNVAGSRPDAGLPERAAVPDGAALAGPIERYGARVLLFDDVGRLLLVRGHDPHRVERTFWFTPGGGIEPGESAREAAVRELAEETGYVLEPHELAGPVWLRTAVFDFASRPYTQHEEIYVGRLADAERRPLTTVVFTADEEEALDEVAWLTHAEVAAEEREVFPDVLRSPWAALIKWDGTTVQLGVNPE